MTTHVRTFSIVIVVLSWAIARPAAAQSPDAPNLVGRVSTLAGAPLSGVEVRIDGTSTIVQTDEGGTYRFMHAPTGVHTLRFRRIGYLPGALAVNVPFLTDSITLVMVPARSVLDTVKVTAHINVVGGIVVDSKNRPVTGAKVDMIGSTKSTTTTDAGGWFNFSPVKSGPLIIKARKTGFAEGKYSFDLQDSRGIVLHVEALPRYISESRASDLSGFGNNEEFLWNETQQRMDRRDARSRIVSREQLAAFSGKSLGEAIRMSDVGNSVREGLRASNDQACVLEDGFLVVGYTSLDAFATDDVDYVELYPPGTESSGIVQRDLRNADCRSTRSGISRGPFFAVIWRR